MSILLKKDHSTDRENAVLQRLKGTASSIQSTFADQAKTLASNITTINNWTANLNNYLITLTRYKAYLDYLNSVEPTEKTPIYVFGYFTATSSIVGTYRTFHCCGFTWNPSISNFKGMTGIDAWKEVAVKDTVSSEEAIEYIETGNVPVYYVGIDPGIDQEGGSDFSYALYLSNEPVELWRPPESGRDEISVTYSKTWSYRNTYINHNEQAIEWPDQIGSRYRTPDYGWPDGNLS